MTDNTPCNCDQALRLKAELRRITEDLVKCSQAYAALKKKYEAIADNAMREDIQARVTHPFGRRA